MPTWTCRCRLALAFIILVLFSGCVDTSDHPLTQPDDHEAIQDIPQDIPAEPQQPPEQAGIDDQGEAVDPESWTYTRYYHDELGVTFPYPDTWEELQAEDTPDELLFSAGDERAGRRVMLKHEDRPTGKLAGDIAVIKEMLSKTRADFELQKEQLDEKTGKMVLDFTWWDEGHRLKERSIYTPTDDDSWLILTLITPYAEEVETERVWLDYMTDRFRVTQ